MLKSRGMLALAAALCFGGATELQAQRVAVKTNALAWLTASPNAELECVVGQHLSLNLGVAANPLSLDKYRTTFVHVQPELRYWVNRPMVSHFVGVTGFLNNYRLRWKAHERQGDAVAAGLTYGYAWPLNDHWNVEATLGVGVLHYRQYKWTSPAERPLELNDKQTVLAPVKLGVSFVYVL